jgi:hypothetical protein
MEGTYLLAMRGPAFRRHDSYPGFRTELENRVGDAKGKSTSGDPTRPKVSMHRSGAHCFVRAMKRGNARGANGAGHSRQDGVNGKPDELLVLAEAGRLPRGGTSRMTREWSRPDLWAARGEIPWADPARPRRAIVDLNAHEGGNGGKKPRETCSLPSLLLLGDTQNPRTGWGRTNRSARDY